LKASYAANKPLTELHHALLVTGRAEMTAFTGERQQIFVAAVFAFNPGKAVFQIAAVEIAADHFLNIMPPEAVIP